MKHALVVTSISEPTPILYSLAEGAQKAGWPFYLIGDEKSPQFPDDRTQTELYFSVKRQLESGLEIAQALPLSNYSRKNIGYLLAMQDGAEVIVETDDDNRPLEGFFRQRVDIPVAPVYDDYAWLNALDLLLMSGETIWPRGFPLDEIIRSYEDNAFSRGTLDSGVMTLFCPIQQGLIDGAPDVDAIRRLTIIEADRHVWLDSRIGLRKSWCPFNSQNTTWFKPAFPLLYLPSYCKDAYRMDDIWRSFVAQRIAFENGWSILWGGVTVFQERNPHDLMKDFEQEIPGYLYNRQIVEMLKKLPIERGTDKLYSNLRMCYQMLVERGFVGLAELSILECWIRDCQKVLQ